LDVTIFPIYNRNKLEGRVFVAHDISDRIDLENNLKTRLAEIQELHEKLEEQATREPLTGLYNRRFLAEALDRETSRAKREEKPVSIIMLDMDYFKNFNDSYGHKCGDEVLRSIAKFLVENVRHEDVACRYGGEEFVILMPNATLESAYERAENWRKIFQSNAFEYEGLKLQATFSAGVASFPLHGEDGESVLQAADKALYHSKNNGRDLVTVYNNKI
jgi:diguanylate cyclase (GGDEF)-like protein